MALTKLKTKLTLIQMKTITPLLLLLAGLFFMPAQAVQAQDKTIVEIAMGNENFETLVAAVKAADLVETLNGEGNFTVFAPTDDAFAALPAGLVEALVKPENQAVLQQILTYHVIGSKLVATDVVAGIKQSKGTLTATTVAGSDFSVMAKGGNVMIKDGQGNVANVTATDIMASNGVIHVIDRVLLPAGIDPAALLPAKPMNDKPTIAAAAIATDQLSTLVTALKAADLVDVFSSPGEYTVFAPTNDAFAELPDGTLATLTKPENKAMLQGILKYHVVTAPIAAADLLKILKDKGYYRFSALSGQSVVATIYDGKVKLIDESGNVATVVATDVMASNGIVHLIDGVLLPKSK